MVLVRSCHAAQRGRRRQVHHEAVRQAVGVGHGQARKVEEHCLLGEQAFAAPADLLRGHQAFHFRWDSNSVPPTNVLK